MVVRAGRAGVLLDPPHRDVLGRPAGLAAGAVQRPRRRARPRGDAQPGAGPEACRPERHRPAGQAGH